MRIEAVIVSVNYGDLLAVTLPTVGPYVNDVCVITTPDDAETIAATKAIRSCAVFTTDAFYRDGDAFNKGRALEEFFGSGMFRLDDWMLCLDADIAMPMNMRQVIETEVTDKAAIHGAPAVVCGTPALWNQVGTAAGQWQLEHLSRRPLPNEVPGYFQLWHSSAVERPWFETDWGHAGGYDSMFQRRFGDRRVWLSQRVVHLGEPRENWFGRRSQRWSANIIGQQVGPTQQQIQDADADYRQLRRSGTQAHKAKTGKIRPPV